MATKTRVWLPKTIYHITMRGNRKEQIFLEKEDYKRYLKIFDDSIEFYKESNYKIACYCLMGNHVHFLLYMDEEPLDKLLQRLHSIYAKYFNKKYGYVGHLFEKRYYSEPIKDEQHLLDSSKYIHRNPIKANIINDISKYEWSSYQSLIGRKMDKRVDEKLILNLYRDNYSKRYELYEYFVWEE